MLSYRTREYGGLRCTVASPEKPRIAAVLMHGFGATGSDLVPIAEELHRLAPGILCCIFPEAPLAPPEFADFGGRAWWPVDMERLQRAAMLGEIRDLRSEKPPLLPASREHILQLLGGLRTQFGWGLDRIILGGFSQGAMLATDVALRLDGNPAGLIVWSGTLLSEDEWSTLAPRRKGLRVVISHGRQDPILPFSGATALRDLFVRNGLPVTFLPFEGPHTIAGAGLLAAAELVRATAPPEA